MVTATMTDRAALLVGNVTEKILSQLRLYDLAPQIQQDTCGYRQEFVVVLCDADRKAAFRRVADNLRIQIQ
jgi:hypothetical protein